MNTRSKGFKEAAGGRGGRRRLGACPTIILGWCSVALGVAGVFLPGVPTTVFVIAASYLFARSSPRFDAWLRTNRLLGPKLRRYHDYGGGMPRSAKVAALTSMWTAITLSSIALARVSLAGPILTVALGGIGTLTILFLVRTVPAIPQVRQEPGGSPANPGTAAAVSPR